MVPGTGFEPARPLRHWILSPARLPIPPSRQVIHSVDEHTQFIRGVHAFARLESPAVNANLMRGRSLLVWRKVPTLSHCNPASHLRIVLSSMMR